MDGHTDKLLGSCSPNPANSPAKHPDGSLQSLRSRSITLISYGNSGCSYVPGVASLSTTVALIGSLAAACSVGYHSLPAGSTTNRASRSPTHASDLLGEPYVDSLTGSVSHATTANGSGTDGLRLVRPAISSLLPADPAAVGGSTHAYGSQRQQHRPLRPQEQRTADIRYGDSSSS